MTMAQLQGRGWKLANRHVLCKEESQPIEHILLRTFLVADILHFGVWYCEMRKEKNAFFY